MIVVLMTCWLSDEIGARQNEESYYVEEFPVSCRKEDNGVMRDYQVRIPLNPDPINNPNNPGTYGTCRIVLGNDRTKTNCKNSKYDYMEVNIDENGLTISGDRLFRHADNKAYWDHYYRDYDGPQNGKCDYSKNCHGFAFGVGDWPTDASVGVILNAYPPNEADRCYRAASIKDATIATADGHTIRVIGRECDPKVLPLGGRGFALPNPYFSKDRYVGVLKTLRNSSFLFSQVSVSLLKQDQDPDDPVIGKIEIFVHSAEQFRESSTYTQTSTCEKGSVDVNKAHVRAGVEFEIGGVTFQGSPFKTFKPN